MIDVENMIKCAMQNGASDIHIVNGHRPIFRINRSLVELSTVEPLKIEDVQYLCDYFMQNHPALKTIFEERKRVDLSYEVDGNNLRVNISLANGVPTLTMRTIKNELPQFANLNLPDIVRRLALMPQGLILVTGKSNSGKSTTLNALIDEVNTNANKKILTLEDPVEFRHTSKKSLIIQKEIGESNDCLTFGAGATNALREDVDILVIGEIRDKETMEAAIEVAEAGHLVFGTMHTRSCSETIDRMLSFYDVSDQLTIKYILSSVLKAVVSQRLLKGTRGGLVMVPEIMIVDDAIAGLIRKEKFSKSEIEDAMQSRAEKGNISLINSLANVVINEKITLEQARLQIPEDYHDLLDNTIRQLMGRQYKNMY